MYNACKKFQNMILYNQLRNMIRKILVIKMTTGERIKMLRKEHNLTQEELGAKIGVQKAAIQKYEKGTVKNIKRDSLIKLAQCLDTSPEYLLGWEDMPNNVEVADASNYVNIPIIGRVAAGLSCFAETNITDYEPVNKNDVRGDEPFVFLRVVGDSGSYAVVMIDEEDGVVKKIVYGPDFIELHSINPMYPVRRFENEDVTRIRVFGLVREIKRKF